MRRSTWMQSPQPRLGRRPDRPLSILVQRAHPLTEAAGLTVCAVILDFAQRPGQTCISAGPYRSFMIHQERVDAVAGKLGILRQLAVSRTGKTSKRADPQRSIGRGEQTSN